MYFPLEKPRSRSLQNEVLSQVLIRGWGDAKMKKRARIWALQ